MAFETTSELRLYVENQLGHELDNPGSSTGVKSTDATAIVNHLDRAHKLVVQGGGLLNYNDQNERVRDEVTFLWAKSKFPKIITLQAPITTLTATVTKNSQAVTLSSTYATSLENWFIRFSQSEEVYRISAHTAGTNALTLDSVYVKASGSKSCTIFKLVYEVGNSDILSLITPIFSHDGEQDINITDEHELKKKFPIYAVYQGFPRLAGILKESSGTITLQFSSYADDLERLELPYIPIPSTLVDGSVNPIIPKEHRLCIAELALYYMLIQNDDDRAGVHLNNARMMFKDLVQHNEKFVSQGDELYGRVFNSYDPIHQTSYPERTVVKAYED